jgi:class 3 adenylate cyclase/tetratricopeptide (TPR) repeat protein
VLFSDLVGFTPLSESRDPEEVRELLSRYFTVARTIIERYGGTVEKFIGDAVMAVWGVPVAHEDDAERAVRAGLELVDAIASLGEAVNAPGLAMRVGVVTGEVAVTLGTTAEGMVAGDAVNTAARVQAAAKPGEVWVDSATRELTAAAVAYTDTGTHELKGKTEPVRLFAARQIVASVGGLRRVDGLEAALTGRDRELRLVKELFHATLEEGRPRLAAVSGPVGVGKSRLGWEFDKYVDGISTVVRVHAGRCLAYGEGVAFWALAEIVRGRLDALEGDTPDVVLQRLHDSLGEYVAEEAERTWLLPRLATLLGIAETVGNAATFERDDLFAAWRTFLERVAGTDAVGAVVRIDDLQWADAGLIDFLEYLLETSQSPIFILTLARPELSERFPTFGSGRRATSLYLEPLPDAAMAELVGGLVDGLPESMRDTLVERSEGVPLFAVETVRSLIDRDAVIPREGRYVLAADAAERVDLADLDLPTSLHTLIASRLDALPAEERRSVQDAAVLGQSFTRDGLATLQQAVGADVDVDKVLAALVHKEVFAVESDPRSPERGQYRFVQALVRGVAYDTLAKRDRKLRHLAAADYLATEPDADTIPAVLAAHLVDAHAAAGTDPDGPEIAGRAIDLLERAARHARDLGAPTEARRHLDTALELAQDDPTIARITELAARAAIATGALTEAAALAERSQEKYKALGMPIDAGRTLALWAETHIAGGHGNVVIDPLTTAYDELKDEPGADPTVAQLALQMARAYYLSIGDTNAAIPWFDRAVLLAEELEDLPLLVTIFASYGGAFVLVGRAHMGLGLLRVALDLARQLDAPQLQLKPLNNLICFLATRELDTAKHYCDDAMTLVRRLGDRDWGFNIAASAIHTYWNSGQWDTALELYHELEDMPEQTTVTALIHVYVDAITEARGLPTITSSASVLMPGMRADIVVEAALALLESNVAREQGDYATASSKSASSVERFTQTSGIDDDFAIIWVIAVADAVEAVDVETARRLVRLVSSAPIGHVSALLRALLPWLQARVDIAIGDDDNVDRSFRTATASLRAFGAPFYLARALYDHACWLNTRGDIAEAGALLDEAGQIFDTLGATPWVERAKQLQGVPVD